MTGFNLAAAANVFAVIVACTGLGDSNAFARIGTTGKLTDANQKPNEQCNKLYSLIEDAIEQIAKTGKINGLDTVRRLDLKYTEIRLNNLAEFGTALQGDIGVYKFSYFKGLRARQRADIQNDDFTFSVSLSGYYPQRTMGCDNRKAIVDKLTAIGIVKSSIVEQDSLWNSTEYDSKDGKLQAKIYVTTDNKLSAFYIGRPEVYFVL